MRTDTSHKSGRLGVSLGLPDLAIDLIHSPSPLVGTLHLHLQNQRGHAVQIEPILEPNAALVCFYSSTHLLGQFDLFQDHEAVVDVFPSKEWHLMMSRS